MATVEQFQKLRVVDIARMLGIHPFDVVRVLTAEGVFNPSLRFEQSDVDKVRHVGGVEAWWTDRPIDDVDVVRPRAILRAIVRELVNRRLVGDRTTRVDNVFRGLAPEDEVIARRAVNLLIQEHLVRTVSTPIGNHVSIIPEQAVVMERMAGGQDMPLGLAALWLA